MTRRTAVVVLVLALACTSVAQAWTLRVDDAGGPADLADRVTAAEQRWRDAGADFGAIERSILVRYESVETMGPDALTLVVTGGPPGVDLEVWVRADAGSDAALDDALVVAIGIALGGTPGVGVLDPRLGSDPRVPSADDVAALAPGRSLPGDVTGDGAVGFEDLLALAEAWGRRGVNLAADLAGDGTVGDADLEILREHYGFAPLPSERTAPTPEAPEPEAPLDGDEDDATDDGDDDGDGADDEPSGSAD
ncbi:MAG: hypothetical protein EA416_05070 [Trueperaceae bacterium]|nr:MAG: hypothetical protein EA416_05070 [Trueperaceae bacterium]